LVADKVNETIVFIRKRRADFKAVQKDTAVLPHEQANHTPIFRSTSSVGSVVEDKLFRLSLPLGLHIQYEGDVLHSRSPSLSTREILRESDILVYPAASVLVSISESLPCGRTRQRSAALPFNGNRQGMALARSQRRSHSLPFSTRLLGS
jgi:hypothetical protein